MTQITAELRERAGKGTARATRRAGKTPAVIYGNKQSPIMISIDTKELETLSRKASFMTQLFDVVVGKDTYHALARDAQRHPVTEQLEHVDFLRVDPKTKIRVAVPVKFVGQDKSPGIKRGGVLNVVMHTIELLVLATKIPTSLQLDLTGLEINDGIHSTGLKLPEGAELTHTEDFTIATIAAPSAIRSELREKANQAAQAEAAPAAAADAAKAPAGDAKAPAKAAAPAAKK